MRDIDRERTALQNQEKKLTLEIKKMAKQGQMVRRFDFDYDDSVDNFFLSAVFYIILTYRYF